MQVGNIKELNCWVSLGAGPAKTKNMIEKKYKAKRNKSI